MSHAFRQGVSLTNADRAKHPSICKENPGFFDIRATSPTPSPMNVKSPPVNLIAKEYGVTRQRLYQLCNKHQLTIGDFCNPEVIFSTLLVSGTRKKLRLRLSDPANREAIKQTLTAKL